MEVQPTNLQNLHDAIMSMINKIFEEYFQQLVFSYPSKIVNWVTPGWYTGLWYTLVLCSDVPNGLNLISNRVMLTPLFLPHILPLLVFCLGQREGMYDAKLGGR